MSEKVRITFELPKSLAEFIDKECERKSTEIMEWNRSTFLRKLIIEARDGERIPEQPKQKQIQKEEPQNQSNNDYFDNLLNIAGYKK